MITYDDFKKVEIKAGKILSAEKIPNTDKLVKLSVDFGEKKEVVTESNISESVTDVAPSAIAIVGQDVQAKANEKIFVLTPRQIVSGISGFFPDPAVLVGKTCMFVTNLEPRTIKGFQSNGMLFAVSDSKGNFSLLEPNTSIAPGTQAA
jgi:tRNA-binding EMAP/Myf-like protein